MEASITIQTNDDRVITISTSKHFPISIQIKDASLDKNRSDKDVITTLLSEKESELLISFLAQIEK